MIVVADTSVFLNLCRVGQAELLRRLYSTVLAPPVVRDEFAAAAARLPRFHGLTFPEWVGLREPVTTPASGSPLRSASAFSGSPANSPERPFHHA